MRQPRLPLHNQGSFIMLNYVITFFLLAVIASFLGFGGLAGTFSQIAQVIAVIFVVLFIVSLLRHTANGKKTPLL
jgi:uncharacterized membrane protein YtjA (UPF0391 family)